MAAILLVLVFLIGPVRQAPAKASTAGTADSTLFAECPEGNKSKRLVSPLSLSEDQKWRTYVDVNIRGDVGCLYTTRLWADSGNEHKLIYFMPPQREAVGNGIKILGWASKSSMVLVRTEEWQVGSDAADTQGIVAIDVRTGLVYAPDLEHMLDNRKDKQCMFRVTDAGFKAGMNVDILVRAHFSTLIEIGEEDVPVAKPCDNDDETWSFNFANGEIKRVSNSEPLLLYRKFVSNEDNH